MAIGKQSLEHSGSGYNFRFFHTYAEEGAIGIAVSLSKTSHRMSLELTLLQKMLLRVKAMAVKEGLCG